MMHRNLLLGIGIAMVLAIGAMASTLSTSQAAGRTVFAAGVPGDAKRPFRVVEVLMNEGDGKMFYVPDRIQVTLGEQIKFVLKNEGVLKHEFMLDTVAANAKHAKAMQKNPEMVHEDANGKQADPKQAVELLWRFTKLGTFEFACLHPGHYDAGMKGVVVVAAAAKKSSTK